ncbi:MAG: hypothetical protein R2827_08885 [Bdellovibrionales bacterium]
MIYNRALVAPTGIFQVASIYNVTEDINIFTVASGTTFTHNNGRVRIGGTDSWMGGTPHFVVDVPTTLNLYDLGVLWWLLEQRIPGLSKVASGDTLIVGKTLALPDGYLQTLVPFTSKANI